MADKEDPIKNEIKCECGENCKMGLIISEIGDKIKVFRDNFEVEDMAKIAQTVPQEILCGFGGNVRMEKVYI